MWMFKCYNYEVISAEVPISSTRGRSFCPAQGSYFKILLLVSHTICVPFTKRRCLQYKHDQNYIQTKKILMYFNCFMVQRVQNTPNYVTVVSLNVKMYKYLIYCSPL